MKILLFVIAVVVLLWLLRGGMNQRPRSGDAPAAPPRDEAPQQIVACAQCGVHLPSNEALPGKGGVFCGDAHRTAFEKEHTARS